MSLVQLLLVLCAVSLHLSAAWILPPTTSALARPPSTKLFVVETISLENMTNHEEDGSLLAESIARWLDHEWMPQEVHVRMGESAKASYIATREAGKDDVMDIMMQVSSDLEANWKQYDDAFVNAYDVGNYVADYLTKRSGNEGCECSSQIF